MKVKILIMSTVKSASVAWHSEHKPPDTVPHEKIILSPLALLSSQVGLMTNIQIKSLNDNLLR